MWCLSGFMMYVIVQCKGNPIQSLAACGGSRHLPASWTMAKSKSMMYTCEKASGPIAVLLEGKQKLDGLTSLCESNGGHQLVCIVTS